MHGMVQRDSESCRSLKSGSSQHLRSLLPLANSNNTLVVAGDSHSPRASSVTRLTTSTTSDSFLKVLSCWLFLFSFHKLSFIFWFASFYLCYTVMLNYLLCSVVGDGNKKNATLFHVMSASRDEGMLTAERLLTCDEGFLNY